MMICNAGVVTTWSGVSLVVGSSPALPCRWCHKSGFPNPHTMLPPPLLLPSFKLYCWKPLQTQKVLVASSPDQKRTTNVSHWEKTLLKSSPKVQNHNSRSCLGFFTCFALFYVPRVILKNKHVSPSLKLLITTPWVVASVTSTTGPISIRSPVKIQNRFSNKIILCRLHLWDIPLN